MMELMQMLPHGTGPMNTDLPGNFQGERTEARKRMKNWLVVWNMILFFHSVGNNNPN
jgi:hypothetical protein